MHALAHPLGARYNAHHGLLNAILMPYVLQANRPVLGDKLSHLARTLGLDSTGVDGVLAWVLDLRQAIGIPNTLADIGIDAAEAALIGAQAEADPTAATNPVPFTAEQYTQLLGHAVTGELKPVD